MNEWRPIAEVLTLMREVHPLRDHDAHTSLTVHLLLPNLPHLPNCPITLTRPPSVLRGSPAAWTLSVNAPTPPWLFTPPQPTEGWPSDGRRCTEMAVWLRA